jgi:dipeptidyl aminopeptidase/acylaminoacyl peptidase
MSAARFAAVTPLIALTLVCTVLPATAQSTTDAVYQVPDQKLVHIVDAPPTPVVRLSPTNEWMLLVQYPSLPSIAELAERELRLAGMRIKPSINGRSRTTSAVDMLFVRLDDLRDVEIVGLPEDPRIESVRWSPDGKRIAFTHTTPDGIELWVAEIDGGQARRLTGPTLSLTSGNAPVWLADSRTLVTAMVPAGRGAEPIESAVPTGPVIQQNLGDVSPARTYQDLLENSHDEALFEYYFTAQLATVSIDAGATNLGQPGIIWDFSTSPDGDYILVQTLHRPFSYLFPASRFPRRIEVMDTAGNPVFRLADLPLQDGIPIAFGSVATGPRSVTWRADAPATLAWVEAQDGGDAGKEAAVRDKLFSLDAPFSGQPVELATLGLRYGGVSWGSNELALVTEWWWKTRSLRTWRIRPGDTSGTQDLLFERSFEDRYADPGSPDTHMNEWGRPVILPSKDGGSMYLVGMGASPEGDRPFLDRFDLDSRKTERLFRSAAPYYERPVQVLDEDGRYLLTSRESVDEPANYYVRDLIEDTERQLTRFPHPTPDLAGIHKEMVRYERADGVKLTGTLYLPAGYDASDGPLPMLVWAYPQEFKSADAAGQVTDSPYRFARVGWWSPLVWLAAGYAVFDDPTLPIVGEGDTEPNDTYIDQLVSGAAAAVDVVVERGVTEPGMIAIGGHSYGAFMTANLLAHSDLFAAGIARSGAYNRTLTPFGFQAEERTVWEAPEIYFEMSPFMHAEKVNEPILLIHGELDNNSGTYPMQSERYFNALKGLGATARLVMLPYESHGYRSRESILHMLWETQQWMDAYLTPKPAPPEETTSD